jgi:hypothetical protein
MSMKATPLDQGATEAVEIRLVDKAMHLHGTFTLAELRASLKGKDASIRENRDKSIKQYEELDAS